MPASASNIGPCISTRDGVYVEVLRPDGSPARAGEVGMVVVTDLVNRAMPIIRYQVGDTAALASGQCRCGRGLPLLDSIAGRVADYVVFRRRPGMWETSTATHGPMAVRSDGTILRNVFRQCEFRREHVCSPSMANECFAMADGTKLVACDLKSGATGRTLARTRKTPLIVTPATRPRDGAARAEPPCRVQSIRPVERDLRAGRTRRPKHRISWLERNRRAYTHPLWQQGSFRNERGAGNGFSPALS